MQHFIQKAMHANPACRGSASDLLAHQWILQHTGQPIKPHWAPPEPSFAQSQIPGPPGKGASRQQDAAARLHQYKAASGVDPSAVAAATALAVEASDTPLQRTHTWDPACVVRPDVKHTLDSQVSNARMLVPLTPGAATPRRQGAATDAAAGAQATPSATTAGEGGFLASAGSQVRLEQACSVVLRLLTTGFGTRGRLCCVWALHRSRKTCSTVPGSYDCAVWHAQRLMHSSGRTAFA